MVADKEELRKEFSEERPELYQVSLFREKGFIRKKCKRCGRYFWTLDPDREYCPNQPCSRYEFIRNPSGKKLDYVSEWNEIKDFFVRNGHTYVRRYPVVARWRDDLYFTVASIIDFQRVEGGKVIFDFPHNPLIVPQMSLRFNDLANVGLTGRHYTSFCMIGQHALANEQGYWKDRTIELDFRLLTERLGIPEKEVVFVEDVWLGYGAFGYSLEYFVKNLELGNAVFTEFEGSPDSYRRFEPPVVDMGAGLERFVWLGWGTPASYDAVFAGQLKELREMIGLDVDEGLKERFFLSAGEHDFSEGESVEDLFSSLNMSQKDLEAILALRDAYAVLDHSRTLLFAIVDGQLPSNVGGGYNIRVVLRRMFDILKRRGWGISVYDLMKLHAEHLRAMYPELEGIEAYKEVLDVELNRYEKLQESVNRIIERLPKGKELKIEDVARLYESNGVNPEVLHERGLIKFDPAQVMSYLASRHEAPKLQEVKPQFDPSGIKPTEQLFYERVYDFTAKVLNVQGDYVILDRTAFYPRSGGQEPDRGTLDGVEVIDVVKIKGVIGHRVKDPASFYVGKEVSGHVDVGRREALMRHHTATHIVNYAARKALGPWVWQHSAFKEEDKARIDITHHSALTDDDVANIERIANELVLKNVRVEKLVMPRTKAEEEFGFRIYQGGAVPGDTLRIIKIGDYDVEACGGTHCDYTGEVGMIKILKVERVQDGVDRIEFVAGLKSLQYTQSLERTIREAEASLSKYSQGDVVEASKKAAKRIEELEELSDALITLLAKSYAATNSKYLIVKGGMDKESAIRLGDEYVNISGGIFAYLYPAQNGTGFVLISAREGSMSSGEIGKDLISRFGGSGGGRGRIFQGALKAGIDEAESYLMAKLTG